MVVSFLNELKGYLKTKSFVCDVNVEFTKPVLEENFQVWESNNGVTLPVDIKDFYLTTDGLYFCWYNTCSDGKTLVGQIDINSLDRLKKTQYVIERIDETSHHGSEENELNQFLPELQKPVGSVEHLFLLEKCMGSGYVALGYFGEDSSILFIDRDGCTYKICDTFTQYVRLAVAHLGLIDWHAWYTPNTPSVQAMQYAALFTPERMFLASKGMRLGNEVDPVSYPTTTINTKVLSCLETTVNGKSSYAQRNVPFAMTSKRGRSNDSTTHRSGEVNVNTGRKHRI